ncbi:hypothetical protein H0H81_002625 [Sphagnurus paluster]|uniref:C2H2-type domain-containing protein n=1 Tax=Sphagnurus paluster TaxID=117069 RepID=A0A9P7KPF6_9AGAR|nr:hypothetical protein H0H81_002625 [Sphagnurus paluster]
MNTHNNLKPFPCGYPGCPRMFTVRSNAKRHLRTHGVDISAPRETPTLPYIVGFDTPTVVSEPAGAAPHELAKTPYKLRWMPPSLSAQTNASNLTSLSDEESDSDDAQEEDLSSRSGDWDSRLTIPLQPVSPDSAHGNDPHRPFEERDSFVKAPPYPYHPSQVCLFSI